MTTIAIDGPAGAGKSSVAQRVAEGLGFEYLDTGAMYRAVALVALEEGIDLENGAALGRRAAELAIRVGDRVTIDGRDVTVEIRSPRVSEVVSKVASHETVREVMADHQRRIATDRDVVMEGRDIGTVVVPGAEVKIFLTASAHERAKRRARQLGVDDPDEVDDIAQSIAARDRKDSERAASPLRKADGAFEVDSTNKSLEEVVEEIVGRARKVLG